MGEHQSDTNAEPFAREPRVLLGDLTSGLLWPSLLRATPLCLRTGRIVLALGAWILILLIGNLNTLWSSDEPAFIDALSRMIRHATSDVVGSAVALNAHAFITCCIDLGDIPRRLVNDYPVSTFVLGIPILAIWVRVGGAISRSAAEEFSLGRVQPWNESMRLSLKKWPALLGAVLAPLAIVAVLALIMAVLGLVFAVPALHLLPSALYPLFLLAGAISVIITIFWIIGHPLLIPGVACEGTDALDSIQRAAAYVISRPARFALYGAILILQGSIIFGLGSGLVSSVIGYTQQTTGSFIGETPQEILRPIAPGESVSYETAPAPTITLASLVQDDDEPEAEQADAEPSGPIVTHGWSRRVVNFWTGALELLLGALLISYFFTGSTLLYLLLRRLCDGQDTAELWVPAPDQA